jgi:ABC-type molybdate transport system substrate-binding protein
VLVALVGLVGLVGLVTLAACGDDANDLEDIRRAEEAAATTAPTGPQLEGTVKVLASSPLTDAFDELDAAFEEIHPLVTVEIDYGGSNLRDLILADVPADVFATGTPADMDALADEGALAGTAETFATDASRNDYSVAALSTSTNGRAADAFVAFVLSGRARNILTSHDFTPPSP